MSPASADEGRSLRLRRAIVLAARRQTAEVMVLFARNIVRLVDSEEFAVVEMKIQKSKSSPRYHGRVHGFEPLYNSIDNVPFQAFISIIGTAL